MKFRDFGKQLSIFSLLLSAFALGCSSVLPQGPSDSQIEQDARSTVPRCKDSTGQVVLDDVKVTGKSVDGGKARVLVKLEFHYLNGRTEVWLAFPCAVFNVNGNRGTVEAAMEYRKYDTGWHLETTLSAPQMIR